MATRLTLRNAVMPPRKMYQKPRCIEMGRGYGNDGVKVARRMNPIVSINVKDGMQWLLGFDPRKGRGEGRR